MQGKKGKTNTFSYLKILRCHLGSSDVVDSQRRRQRRNSFIDKLVDSFDPRFDVGQTFADNFHRRVDVADVLTSEANFASVTSDVVAVVVAASNMCCQLVIHCVKLVIQVL